MVASTKKRTTKKSTNSKKEGMSKEAKAAIIVASILGAGGLVGGGLYLANKNKNKNKNTDFKDIGPFLNIDRGSSGVFKTLSSRIQREKRERMLAKEEDKRLKKSLEDKRKLESSSNIAGIKKLLSKMIEQRKVINAQNKILRKDKIDKFFGK